MIPINLPKICEEEVQALVKVFRSGMLTSGLGAGPKVSELETKFAKFCSSKHEVAVNNGNACLKSAVMGVGVKQGDEVILPRFTFVATVEEVVSRRKTRIC